HGSLVPLECEEWYCRAMQGLALRNIGVKAFDETGKVVYDDFGELLFTHFGISGPTVLSMSAHLSDIGKKHYTVSIDLKPALDEATLDKRLLSDFSKYGNRNFDNSLSDLLPKKMIDVFVKLSGVSPVKKVNEITKEERRRVAALLKDFRVTVKRTRPIDEAIVTAGGIDVRGINPKTMESKQYEGLYFAGEVIDVDAYTGGFNLQIAFSTARLAAESAVFGY
ncbi:MAG: aminoacetone oxidase family FAD-binding enzyme, partial [Clostridia bacterium]|nr:aminoacetone oxidase family FAD-binding enzyme [Clostridia bacterium]